MSERQLSFPCTIMRGGTSKGVFLMDSDLPSDPEARDRILLAIMGSPDIRQIDGLGGADPLTSKVVIVRHPSRPDVDVEYTFAQVSITEPFVDYSGNCGNLCSAVGPFAIEKRIVRPEAPVTRVRILNTNTNKLIIAHVPVRDGQVVTRGDYRIDGVPGTGAEIRLEFLDPGGARTGKLLPTGRARETISLEDGRRIAVSMIDAGNPAVFVDARALGLSGTELPEEMERSKDLLATISEIRGRAAEAMGLVASWKDAARTLQSIPKIALVAKPASYATIQRALVREEEIDLVARVMSMGRPHKAYAITAAIPTASAALLEGTIVREMCRRREDNLVRIGHPSGIIKVEAWLKNQPGGPLLEKVAISRTARKIMEGVVYLP